MKACQTLFCFIFLIALQAGNIGLNGAEVQIYNGNEGHNIAVGCHFPFSLFGSKRFFCRETCEKGNILIDTSDDTAQNGRYGIKYENSSHTLFVTMAQLTKSDTGQYRCHLENTSATDSSLDFKIVVTEASATSKPRRTVGHFHASTFVPSVLTSPPSPPPTATQSLQLSSERSTVSEISEQPQTSPTGVLLYVGLIPVVTIALSSAALLIFYKKRTATKPRGPPVEAGYADNTDARQVYEEVREEDRSSRSPPVEVSTLYTTVKCSQTDGAESSDEYSLATSPQNRAENN